MKVKKKTEHTYFVNNDTNILLLRVLERSDTLKAKQLLI